MAQERHRLVVEHANPAIGERGRYGTGDGAFPCTGRPVNRDNHLLHAASVQSSKETFGSWYKCGRGTAAEDPLAGWRGVAAAPADNSVARQAPPRPGSCYDQ